MKQILKFSILLLFFMPLQKVAGQDIIMGSQPLVPNIGEAPRDFYDPGGENGPFDVNLRDTMTLQTETSSLQLYVWFRNLVMGDYDTLWIYDGPDVSAPLKGVYSLLNIPGEFHSSSNTLTFVFHSDSVHRFGMDYGWNAQVYQYDSNATAVLYGEDPTILTTNAVFYDAGGPTGNIGSSPSDMYQEFIAPGGGDQGEPQHIKCEFSQFQVGGMMTVYDGRYNDPGKRIIGYFCTSTLDASINNNMPPTLVSTKKAMTFVYNGVSGDVSKSGWKAKITIVNKLLKRDDENPCSVMSSGFDTTASTYYAEPNNILDTIVLTQEEMAARGIRGLNGDLLPPIDMPELNYNFEEPLILKAGKNISVGASSNDYLVEQIPYNEADMMFGYDEGSTIVWQQGPARDDSWLGGVDLPFTFTFFGVPYTRVYPSSNGLVSFDAPPEGEWHHCEYSTSVPPASPTLNGGTYSYTSTPYNYYNSAYLVYEDINPAASCTPGGATAIKYGVLGDPPCRAFVFNYNGINLFSCCASTGPNTYQMVMYEGSNIIDVYIKRRNVCTSWNGGRGVVGLQNRKGSQRVIAPGRDFTTTWTVNPNSLPNVGEHWRFTPITEVSESNGDLYWFADTVKWQGDVPDTTSVHFLYHEPLARSFRYSEDPQDTTMYIAVYIFKDATGSSKGPGEHAAYTAYKVNSTKPEIEMESDKKIYCPDEIIHLEVTKVLDPVMTLNDIIRCKWWSAKHPRPLGTSTTRINDVLASYLQPGTTDTIYVMVTFSNKATQTTSVIVSVLDPILPKITSRNFVTKEDYICKGDTLTLLATHPKTDRFTWNTGATSRSIEVHPLNDTLYIVTTDEECHVSDTFKVVVLPLPPTSFTPDPIDIIMDNGIGTVTCTTPLSQGGYQLTWNFDDPNSPDNIVQGPDVVTHGYTRPRDYTITLTAVDANNCDSTYTDRVSVKVPDLFYVPSAFSPNNDEHNQKFQPSGQIVDPDRPYSMEIFNRYGMLVFSTNSPYDYWDGRNKKGELCPEGVYVYMISFYHINEHDNPDALPAVRKGTVTLLR